MLITLIDMLRAMCVQCLVFWAESQKALSSPRLVPLYTKLHLNTHSVTAPRLVLDSGNCERINYIQRLPVPLRWWNFLIPPQHLPSRPTVSALRTGGDLNPYGFGTQKIEARRKPTTIRYYRSRSCEGLLYCAISCVAEGTVMRMQSGWVEDRDYTPPPELVVNSPGIEHRPIHVECVTSWSH